MWRSSNSREQTKEKKTCTHYNTVFGVLKGFRGPESIGCCSVSTERIVWRRSAQNGCRGLNVYYYRCIYIYMQYDMWDVYSRTVLGNQTNPGWQSIIVSMYSYATINSKSAFFLEVSRVTRDGEKKNRRRFSRASSNLYALVLRHPRTRMSGF